MKNIGSWKAISEKVQAFAKQVTTSLHPMPR